MELFSIIKNDGPGNVLFWKFTGEDFNTNSRLIVNPGEQAVFVKNGIIHAVFDNGDYTLETNNYPFISALRKMASGGVSAFNCLVYFVRTADAMNLVWGTPSPLQVRDPKWDISVRVKANGSYVVKITNPGLFLDKFVGNNRPMITLDMFKTEFRSEVLQELTSSVAKALQTSEDEILITKNDLSSLAKQVTPILAPFFEPYGVTLERFNIAALDIDDRDPSYMELQTIRNSRNQKRVGAMGDVDELEILGDNWQRIQARNIMMGMATNEGAAGAAAGAGAGMGMGMAAGGIMGTMASSMFAPMQQQQQQQQTAPQAAQSSRFAPKVTSATITCQVCQAQLNQGAKFCGECGNKVAQNSSCPNCKSEVAGGAKFCNECGTKLN